MPRPSDGQFDASGSQSRRKPSRHDTDDFLVARLGEVCFRERQGRKQTASPDRAQTNRAVCQAIFG